MDISTGYRLLINEVSVFDPTVPAPKLSAARRLIQTFKLGLKLGLGMAAVYIEFNNRANGKLCKACWLGICSYQLMPITFLGGFVFLGVKNMKIKDRLPFKRRRRY